jgi:ABC-type uncharacterized transport system involved in gliding motility auxiliary subunit
VAVSADTDARRARHLEIVEFSRRRRIWLWTWFFATCALLVGALVFVNAIAHRHAKRWDLTLGKVHSIDPGTRQLLSKIEKRVEVYVTVLQATTEVENRALPQAWVHLRSLLQEFEESHPRRYIEVRWVEAEGDALINDIVRYFQEQPSANMIYIVAHPRADNPGEQIVKTAVPIESTFRPDPQTGNLREFFGEGRLASAILQVASDRRHVVYHTVGHREYLPGPGGDLSTLQRALINWANTELRELDLQNAQSIPADCEALLIPGLEPDLSTRELDMIEQYLKEGGRLFVAPHLGQGKDLARRLEGWGLKLKHDVVLDPTGLPYRPASQVLVREFSLHPINEGMRNIGFVMPMTRSVDALPGTAERQAWPLMRTVPEVWAQDVTRRIARYEIGDERGPALAACSETKLPAEPARRRTAKIIAWGTALPLTNGVLNTQAGQRDDYVSYIVNNFRWLLDMESTIAAPPKQARNRPLEMTPKQRTMMLVVCVGVMPCIGVVLGVVAWMFRRK